MLACAVYLGVVRIVMIAAAARNVRMIARMNQRFRRAIESICRRNGPIAIDSPPRS